MMMYATKHQLQSPTAVNVTMVISANVIIIPSYTNVIRCLGTNLIHDFTVVTFSVKLAFFREKCPFPCFHEIP